MEVEPHLIALTCKTGSIAMAAVALVTVARVTVATVIVVLEKIIFFCNFFNSTHTLLLCPSLKRVLVQSKREREREGVRGGHSSLSLGLFVV